MTSDLAVDLGTSSTRVIDRGGQVLVNEPTLAAVDADSGRLLAFGGRALGTGARSAGRVHLVRPVRRGQLVDLPLAEEILADALQRVGGTRLGHPRVIACVHVASTPVQHRAIERALRKAGARQVRFVEQPIAGALGAGLAIEEPFGSMVVEVGAGTTDIGILALGGIVASAALDHGGDDLDTSVRNLLARRHNLLVDHATATELRRSVATALPDTSDAGAEVLGRDALSGRSSSTVVTRGELAPLVGEFLSPILDAAVNCIASSPPDLANDLLGRGIVLTGGLSAMEGFDTRLAQATGLPVHVAPDPHLTAVRGARLCGATFELSAKDHAPRRR